MKFLYIFPHPDDESFGPAAAMHAQLQQGHEVYLYTLTKGGASRQRFKYNLSIEEMGEVRYREMLAVEKTLGLSGMRVDDFPDSGLKELDPRIIERVLEEHISDIKPDIVVSYPVHGISGFHDHLIMHAVIKRVFLAMRDNGARYLRRLAFFTLPDNGKPLFEKDWWRLKQSEEELIDCVMTLGDDDREALRAALDCYETYRETIEQTNVVEKIGDTVYFEIFGENFTPPLDNLASRLPDSL
jgi:LmbE family N-acetylglucosaminyl deacetylase